MFPGCIESHFLPIARHFNAAGYSLGSLWGTRQSDRQVHSALPQNFPDNASGCPEEEPASMARMSTSDRLTLPPDGRLMI